jgi:hypothetical protein
MAPSIENTTDGPKELKPNMYWQQKIPRCIR